MVVSRRSFVLSGLVLAASGALGGTLPQRPAGRLPFVLWGSSSAAGGLHRERPPGFPPVRIDDLLSRMTLEEKVGQMTQTERYQVFDDATPIQQLSAEVLGRMNFESPYVDMPMRLTVRQNLNVFGMLYGCEDVAGRQRLPRRG